MCNSLLTWIVMSEITVCGMLFYTRSKACRRSTSVHVFCVKRVGSIPPGCAGLVWFMVFNATLNNTSVISWRSVLLAEETVVLGENYQPVASH